MPSLFDIVRAHADARDIGSKLALLSAEDGERSYEALAVNAAALAHAYHRELGVGVGERVCIWSTNRPEWVESNIACSAGGFPTIPANPEWADRELEFVLRHSKTRVIACEAERAERALALRERIEGLEHVVVLDDVAIDGAHAHTELLASAPRDAAAKLPAIPESTPGQLMYTSGTTTGRPKAVPFRRELTKNTIDYHAMFGLVPDDRAIFVTPLFHGNGGGAMSSALLYGASAVFPRRFSARHFWPLVERTQPTYLFTLAPIVNILLGLPPSPSERQHSLRVMIALGSGPAMQQIEERFGVPVIDWYGMTEAGMGTYTRLDEERRPGSAGRPFPDSAMHIVREDGTLAEPGETGEVCFDAEQIGFDGYVEDEEATRAALDERWFHTGDLGRFDADGFFYFVDRKKDIVRRGGENISSIEVEAVLRDHPQIADAAIVGMPDPVLGERIAAFVVAGDGERAPSLEALRAFARTRLAEFKLPERCEVIASLPRTATGKIQKFALRERL